MKTWIAVAWLALTIVLAPAVAADGAEDAEDCSGLVDISCDYGGNTCFLYVEHNAPNVPRCIIGG